MSDTQTALAQVRKALAARPTQGPWHHCQPFQSVRAERTLHGTVPAQRVDFVSTKTQPVHERIIIPMAGKEAHVRSEDMAFIAACNPENIAAILAHVEAQAAEIKRLRKLAMTTHLFEEAPCFLCGYNGPGYYQPEQHPCAALYHEAMEEQR